VVALMANGATSTWKYSYRFDSDGKLDITLMTITSGLSDFLQALGRNDPELAKSIAGDLPFDGGVKMAALRLLEARSDNRKMFSPEEISSKETSFPLSKIKPEEVSVGWGQPAYDHVPRPEGLIISGNELFDRGIYAHAPARHVYRFSENSDW